MTGASAKELATGDEGLSWVIGIALRDYVKEKEDRARGVQDRDLPLNFVSDGLGLGPFATERIAFRGQEIIEPHEVRVTTARRRTTSTKRQDAAKWLAVYRTEHGRLVLLEGDGPEEWRRYAVYGSLHALRADLLMQSLGDRDRLDKLDQIQEQTGESWAIWIE